MLHLSSFIYASFVALQFTLIQSCISPLTSRFCRLYQLSQPCDENEEEIMIKRNIWYILDEFGSSLKQSINPNGNLSVILKVFLRVQPTW